MACPHGGLRVCQTGVVVAVSGSTGLGDSTSTSTSAVVQRLAPKLAAWRTGECFLRTNSIAVAAASRQRIWRHRKCRTTRRLNSNHSMPVLSCDWTTAASTAAAAAAAAANSSSSSISRSRLVLCSPAATHIHHHSSSSKSRRQLSVAAAGEAGGFRIPFLSSLFGGNKQQQKSAEQNGEGSEDADVISDGQVEAAAEEPKEEPPEEAEAVVVGAGLAGLRAALALQEAGVACVVVEASDGIGGRVRTDTVDGFLLDRGFQIFLTAYPEAQAVLDYEKLDLKPFYAGALVRLDDGSFNRVADPFRHLVDGLASLPNSVGTLVDKVLVGVMRLRTVAKPLSEILSAPETSIRESLEQRGFSPVMIDRFFRPFLGGIFFDRDLTTSSRMLEFVIRMLALGANTLPSQGIGQLAQQLADRLPPESIRLSSPVSSVTPRAEDSTSGSSSSALVTLVDGRRIISRRGVIVAIDQPAVAKLLGSLWEASASVPAGEPRGTVCLYFAADEVPSDEPILFLNGTDQGIINNLCFPHTVAPSYAPTGKALVSVSLVGSFPDRSEEELEAEVRRELGEWFGEAVVEGWQHLRTYRIPFAQPSQRPPSELLPGVRAAALGGGVYVCGDHWANATFDGALASGRIAAEALLEDSSRQGDNAADVVAVVAVESDAVLA